MDLEDFFQRLEEQMEKNLPFVAYHAQGPNNGKVQALLQDNSKLYNTKTYFESGFVFAPFNEQTENVFIPRENSEYLETIFKHENTLDLSPAIDYSNSRAIKEKELHIDLVQRGIDTIKEGNLKKVVLSRRETLEIGKQNPLELFQRLLKKYPSAYVYLFHHPLVGTWLGATPEKLLEVERNRFRTMALAGTQIYRGTEEVEWGDKEKEEQKIVTDFVVDKLQGSLKNIQTQGPYTTVAGNLLHLRTDITGEIDVVNNKPNTEEMDPRRDAMHHVSMGGGILKNIISAIHPTPAICGLPRDLAKRFILGNENYDREFYTGFLGEINMKQEIKRSSNRRNQENQAYAAHIPRTSLYVNLRCLKLEKYVVHIFVGGGITAESVPAAEWEETQNKAGTMKAVLDMLDRKAG